jgi:hypothetical protein
MVFEMTVWIGNWAGILFSLIQISFLLPITYYLFKDVSLYGRNRICFENFDRFQKKFDVHYSSFFHVIRLISIGIHLLGMMVFFFGQLWFLGLFLLIGVLFLFGTFGLENSVKVKNRNFSQFSKAHRSIVKNINKLDEVEGHRASVIENINNNISELSNIDDDLTSITPALSLKEGIQQYEQIKLQLNESLDRSEQQITEHIIFFDHSIADYIKGKHTETVFKEVIVSLPLIKDFENQIKTIHLESFNDIELQLSSHLLSSTFSPEEIEQLIGAYTNHNLPLKTKTKQQILNKLASDFAANNESQDRIIEFFYLKGLINRELILESIANSYFSIINKGVFSYLSSEEILNVLQLLIDENSKQAMTRFLKNIPKHLFYLLYHIPRINANEAGTLALRFREYSPLKFEFSDPSVNLYSMYEALLNSTHELPFYPHPGDKFGELLLQHKEQILTTYLAVYDDMEPLMRYMESIKLTLLTSSIQNSPAIRVSSAIELFYDFTTNLKKQDALILLHYIEAMFLHEETNNELLDEFKTPFNEFNRTSHHFDSKTAINVSKSILKTLLQDHQQKLLSIIALVERQRLSYDVVNQWVTA